MILSDLSYLASFIFCLALVIFGSVAVHNSGDHDASVSAGAGAACIVIGLLLWCCGFLSYFVEWLLSYVWYPAPTASHAHTGTHTSASNSADAGVELTSVTHNQKVSTNLKCTGHDTTHDIHQCTLIPHIAQAFINHATPQIPIIYRDEYNITAYGLEKMHPFDSTKYRRVYQQLLSDGLAMAHQFIEPRKPTVQELLLVHTRVRMVWCRVEGCIICMW